jgi:shikimate dehydrogenase
VAVAAMRTLGIAGLAVTMPHKADVATAVHELDPNARALRSVNTVVLRPDGTTLGASTDGDGFVDSLAAAGYEVAGRRVVVLGAGGAARAIVVALGDAGAADIAVLNRTVPTAHEAATLTPTARAGTIDDVAGADLLVNATPVGMGADELPLDAGLLHAGLTVADIVYHPLETALLRAAAQAGCAVVDGLGMLVHQAVRQQQLWTGQRPDPAVLRAAAVAELAGRER